MRKETYNETYNKPLLAPTMQNFKDAETFVEMAKERFPSMVMKCYVLDCPPGKGLYDTSGGNKCNDCTAGSTFSEYTDAKECQANVAKCAAASGLAPSTSASVDATCPTCTGQVLHRQRRQRMRPVHGKRTRDVLQLYGSCSMGSATVQQFFCI